MHPPTTEIYPYGHTRSLHDALPVGSGRVFAAAVVAERLDHAAIGGDAAAATPDDAGKLVAEQGQLRDLRLDLLQMRGRDPVGLAAVARRIVRQVAQRADLDRKSTSRKSSH